jgi:hypothetical protein
MAKMMSVLWLDVALLVLIAFGALSFPFVLVGLMGPYISMFCVVFLCLFMLYACRDTDKDEEGPVNNK